MALVSLLVVGAGSEAETALYVSEEGAVAVQRRYQEILSRWPVPNSQFQLPTRQGPTFVIASGDPAAPPLLLFHGGGTNSSMWSDSVELWSKDFRVYAVDLIGEAGKSAQSRPNFDSDACGQWVADVMQGLSIRKASMVGASLGGWLALDFAIAHPDRVEQLVLLGPLGVGRQKISFLFKAGPLLLLGDWGKRRALRVMVGAPPKEKPGINSSWVDADFEFMLLVQKHFQARRVQLPIRSDEELGRLSMPTLVLVGAQDSIADAEETAQRMRDLAHAKVQTFSEAGHRIYGQPFKVMEFLLQHRPRAAASK